MNATVLIADDHPLFRAAMRQALVGIVGENVLEASTLNEACDILRINPGVELIFLDLHMPGNGGLSGLVQVKTLFPDVLVVVVSAEENPQLIKKVIELEASGYIPKSTPLPQITDAVSLLLDGEQWFPDGLDEVAVPSLGHVEREFMRGMAQLTPHQFKVLKMLADGLLNKQIAYELAISESTVKQHVSAVLRKLKVINRTKAGVIYKQLVRGENSAQM